MFERFKKSRGRMSGREMSEEFQLCPIPFRTKYGGSRQASYKTTRKMQELYHSIDDTIESFIAMGMIDEYTDPHILDVILDAYFVQISNEIKRQYLTFDQVIVSIRNVAKEELHVGKRTEEVLAGVMKAADERKG